MAENSIPQGYKKFGKGWTSTIYQMGSLPKVVKVVHGDGAEKFAQREQAAYERLSEKQDSNILQYYGAHPTIPHGFVLGLAENGCVFKYLHNHPNATDAKTLVQWAQQATRALVHVHACQILHCDIHTANFFLDENLDLKLGDFGGASIDGANPLLMYRTTHQLWTNEEGRWHRSVSVAAEIFALGSAMFNMATGRDPFQELNHEKDHAEIVERLQKRLMPSTKTLPELGSVIEGCWSSKYETMADVLQDLDLLHTANEAGSSRADQSTEGL